MNTVEVNECSKIQLDHWMRCITGKMKNCVKNKWFQTLRVVVVATEDEADTYAEPTSQEALHPENYWVLRGKLRSG